MKLLLLPVLAAIALPTAVNAEKIAPSKNFSTEPKCTITSEYSSDYRMEMYWPASGLLFYKNKPRYSFQFTMSNGYGSDYISLQEWDPNDISFNPRWKGDVMEGGRVGEVVVFVGNLPLFAYNYLSDEEKKKNPKEGQGRVLFIDMAQSFHYLPNTYKDREALYAERNKEWFKVAHNFWRLGKGCKISLPKYFL